MDRMTIKQVAEFVGVNHNTIRNYERAGIIPQPKRTAKGHRYYTVRDAEEIRRIMFPDENGLVS